MSIGFNSNGLNLMHTRLANQGGPDQQSRMIKDKRRTLDRVVLYSYQGARVQRLGDPEPTRALINPNKNLWDYDEKVLSIGFENNFATGDVFEWLNTGTKWLIYLQDLTELAYFKGNIRKCSYEIAWKNEAGNLCTTYAAVEGPGEAEISSVNKSGISMDLPNYDLGLLLPKNEETLKQFQRYSKFYLQDIKGGDSQICWRVEAVNTISNPSIIKVYANEDYANETVDNIEDGIVGGLIIPPIDESAIVGELLIKPRKTYEYNYTGSEISEWSYDKSLPMEITIDDKKIKIKWTTNYGGQFDLTYGTAHKTIIVDSLF